MKGFIFWYFILTWLMDYGTILYSQNNYKIVGLWDYKNKTYFFVYYILIPIIILFNHVFISFTEKVYQY